MKGLMLPLGHGYRLVIIIIIMQLNSHGHRLVHVHACLDELLIYIYI